MWLDLLWYGRRPSADGFLLGLPFLVVAVVVEVVVNVVIVVKAIWDW